MCTQHFRSVIIPIRSYTRGDEYSADFLLSVNFYFLFKEITIYVRSINLGTSSFRTFVYHRHLTICDLAVLENDDQTICNRLPVIEF
jgi:hypothetical protein